jgi:hypothetical protein
VKPSVDCRTVVASRVAFLTLMLLAQVALNAWAAVTPPL